MSNLQKIEESVKVVDLKETKMDGPTFRALKDYFDDWGKEDPTLFRREQRDVKRNLKEE